MIFNPVGFSKFRRAPRHLCGIVALCLVLALIGVARGKTVQSEKRVLTLDEMIQMALEKSPEIARVKSAVAAAKSDLDQVKAAYYPQMETVLLTGPTRDAELPVVVGDQIVDPSPPADISNTGIFGRLEFTITQPIFTFGKLSNRKEAAERGVNAKKYEVQAKRAEIVLRVKQAYYAYVLAHQGIEAADESEAFYKDAQDRIKRLLEVGSTNADQSDLYRIEAYLSDTIRFKAQAESGEQLAYFALKTLIMLPPAEDFEVPTQSLPEQGRPLADVDEYIDKALANRPELKQLKEGIEANKFLVEAARSDRYPDFFMAMQGSFAAAPGRDTLDNAYINDEFNHAGAGVVAGMKWNLDFGISKAKVDKARAEYQGLLHTREFAERNIPLEVMKHYQDAREQKKAVEAYEKGTVAARKWIVAAFSNYDIGLGTAKDMFDALDKYGNNRGNCLEALYSYNLALAQLEFAVGTMDAK